MSKLDKKRVKYAARPGLIAALDIGSSKIACVIAQPFDDGTMEVVGVGHQVSKGVRSGNIVDMSALELGLSATVETAEQIAREQQVSFHVQPHATVRWQSDSIAISQGEGTPAQIIRPDLVVNCSGAWGDLTLNAIDAATIPLFA